MLRIGVVGGGKWGVNHLRVFSQMPCELVGLADIDMTKRGLAERYGIQYERDFRQLLPLVDAIAVATPANTHYKVARHCMLAGKHVLVEKPLALNSMDAKELIDLANTRNLVLAVGHLYRMNPAVIELKKELQSIGRIHYVTLRYTSLNADPPADCGVIFDYGSHLFDILVFLFERMPEKIFCRKIHHLSQVREDCAIILLNYGDFVACLELSWLHPEKTRDAWIIAAKNSVYCDFLGQIIRKYVSENGSQIHIGVGIDTKIKWREPLKEELQHFIDCIENRGRPINSGEEAYCAVRLCELALESGKRGDELAI